MEDQVKSTATIKKKSPIFKALLFAISLIIICTIGFYIFFPGISIAIIAGAWGIIVATITLFTIALLLFFVIPGFFIAIISIFAVLWVLLSIILFPFLFPIIMPIFIILLFIGYLCGNKAK